MTETYYLYEDRWDSQNYRAKVTHVDAAPGVSEQFIVEFNPATLDTTMCPYDRLIYERLGTHILTGQEAKQWIQRRIWQEDYESLPFVLQALRLKHYNIWEIFKRYRGRCTKDNAYIKGEIRNRYDF